MQHKKLPISVFIIALNEADRIGTTIESVIDWVDEIIVVDSGSSDNTVSLSEQKGAKVFFNPWPGYGMQKRFAEEQCRNQWLLNLDADEVVSTELQEEIKQLFADGLPKHSGYCIAIREILPTEHNYPRFGRSVAPVRLYDSKMGRYSPSPVHDRVQMEGGTVGKLNYPFWHYSSRSLSHSFEKINRYSTMQAADIEERRKKFPLLGARILLALPMGFLKAYILRGYIFKGMPGFINAVMYGVSRFLRLAKLYELRR